MYKLFFALSLLLLMYVEPTAAQSSATGSAVENQLLLADPCVLEDDGWYYIYGTQILVGDHTLATHLFVL